MKPHHAAGKLNALPLVRAGFLQPPMNKRLTALLVIDPYNDFISEGGKVWDRLKVDDPRRRSKNTSRESDL